MPMAPSAAAKDSCPARKAKHLVSSLQQHGGQIAVADADLAVVRDRTGDAEGLQAFAQGRGDIGRLGLALLDGDGRAEHIGPAGVLKADRLDALDDGVDIDALGVADCRASSREAMPYFCRTALIWSIRVRSLQTVP